MRLYNLVSAQFALSNLAMRRLKVSRYSDLNDPFELLAADLENPRHVEYFRRIKEKVDRTNGLLCFSKNYTNPVLWSHYADKHRGVALGFDVNTPHLLPITYAEKPTTIKINPDTDLPIFDGPDDPVLAAIASTKFG